MKSLKFSILKKIRFSTKAQLTMFMILGIMIIAVFGFVFFATGEVQRQQTAQQAEQIISQVLETTSLKFYINLCADKALENGIDILSKQGGKIFPGQQGSIITNQEKVFSYKDEPNNKTYIVAYGVLKEDTPLPQYPCKVGYEDYNLDPDYCKFASTLQDGSLNYKFSSLDFGIINMPSLCTTPLAGCGFREGWDASFSVQAQLENYISEYVRDCVDLNSIIGVNETYNVSEGDVMTSITFSDEDVTALIKFPVVVKPLIGQPVINLVSFQTSIPTRFKVIYGLARETVANDVSSPSAQNFEIVSGFNTILTNRFGNIPSGFEIQKFEDITGRDNFIRIVDKTITSGKELILQFLEENRPPVLEYLYLGSSVDTPCGSYDIVQLEGTNLTINPKAFDTEEDTISYSFNGWLYNYSENITAEENDITGCPVTVKKERGNLYTNPSQARLRSNANGYASTLLTKDDIGPHNLTVTVCDSQYCDFQLIRILVDDLLKIKINGTNPSKTKIFSIEDPFMLTAKIENLYLDTGNYGYKWFIFDGINTIYSNLTAGQNLNLPAYNYNINNIIKQNNLTLLNTLGFGKTYRVLSVVTQGIQSVSSPEYILTPSRCVDYRNPQSPYPYPYNDTDPFLSSHLCCQQSQGTYVYADTGTKCYTPNPTFGSYNSFNTNRYRKSNDPSYTTQYQFTGGASIATIKAGVIANQISDDANDIIKREFYRSCDGKRGNICNGTISEIYSVAESCADLGQNEIARCEGPAIDLLNINTEIEVSTGADPPICVSYGLGTPTTFEKAVNPSITDIRCNSQPKCVSSDNSGNGYVNVDSANIKFVCNATCGPNGCTRTIPSLCVNCYSKQTCSGPELNELNEGTQQQIQYRKFNGCSNAQCNVDTTPITRPNSCSGTILTQYYCRDQSEIPNSNSPYNSKTFDCVNYNERLATDSDGDNPLVSICTDYSPGSCTTDHCTAQAQSNEHQEKQTPDPTQGFTGEYKFIEYEAKNTRGTSMPETCVQKLHSFDESSSWCTKLTYICASGTSKTGTWVSGTCVGDDNSERTNC